MTMMMRCPFRRRNAGLMLFTHLLLVGLLPMGEVLHRHGNAPGVELHSAGEECGHEGYHAQCSLLRIGSTPALRARPASLAPAAAFVVTRFSPASSAGLPSEAVSPALPRAPPVD